MGSEQSRSLKNRLASFVVCMVLVRVCDGSSSRVVETSLHPPHPAVLSYWGYPKGIGCSEH